MVLGLNRRPARLDRTVTPGRAQSRPGAAHDAASARVAADSLWAAGPSSDEVPTERSGLPALSPTYIKAGLNLPPPERRPDTQAEAVLLRSVIMLVVIAASVLLAYEAIAGAAVVLVLGLGFGLAWRVR